MTPDFGAVSGRRITILRPPLYRHIKTANEARSVIARLEYAMQHGHRETASALALMAQELVSELVQATE